MSSYVTELEELASKYGGKFIRENEHYVIEVMGVKVVASKTPSNRNSMKALEGNLKRARTVAINRKQISLDPEETLKVCNLLLEMEKGIPLIEAPHGRTRSWYIKGNYVSTNLAFFMVSNAHIIRDRTEGKKVYYKITPTGMLFCQTAGTLDTSISNEIVDQDGKAMLRIEVPPSDKDLIERLKEQNAELSSKLEQAQRELASKPKEVPTSPRALLLERFLVELTDEEVKTVLSYGFEVLKEEVMKPYQRVEKVAKRLEEEGWV